MLKAPFAVHTPDGHFQLIIELTKSKVNPFRLILKPTEKATPAETLQGTVFYHGTLDSIFNMMIEDYRFARSHD